MVDGIVRLSIDTQSRNVLLKVVTAFNVNDGGKLTKYNSEHPLKVKAKVFSRVALSGIVIFFNDTHPLKQEAILVQEFIVVGSITFCKAKQFVKALANDDPVHVVGSFTYSKFE